MSSSTLLLLLPASVLVEIVKFLNVFDYGRFERALREGESRWCDEVAHFRRMMSLQVFDWFPCIHRVSSYISWLSRNQLRVRSFAIHRYGGACSCYVDKAYNQAGLRVEDYDMLGKKDLSVLLKVTGASLETLRIKSNSKNFNFLNVHQIAATCGNNLRVLEISILDYSTRSRNLEDRDFECLALNLPRLERVEVRDCGERLSCRSAASFLRHCLSLVSLRFIDGYYFVNDLFLNGLPAHARLESLYICSELYNLTNRGILSLKHKFPVLQHMHISYERLIHDRQHGMLLFKDTTSDRAKVELFMSLPLLQFKHFFIGNNANRYSIPIDRDETFFDDDPVFVDNPCTCLDRRHKRTTTPHVP